MTRWMDLLLVLGTLNVLSGVSQAGPLPADTDKSDEAEEFIFLLGREKAGRSLFDDKQSDQPVKVPFSLELEPPLPDNANGASKPVVLPLRDSYGNPIPPAVLGVDPSGADYDLSGPNSNRNSNNNPKKTVFTQGINFPIPSYASGITEIHRPSDGLLPPFDSDHKPDKDGLPTSSNLPSASVPLPVNELLPPLSVPQTKDDAINEISGTLTNNTPIPDSLSSPALIASTPTASTAIPSATITTTPKTTTYEPVTTKKPFIGGKYTGGFGGAPGILGEQKKIGFDVSTTTTTTPAPTISTTPLLTTTTTSEPPTTPGTTTTTTPLPTTPYTTTTTTTPPPTPPTIPTTTTTPPPPTTPTTTTTTTTFVPPITEVVTRNSVDNGPTRIPIGVAPPGAINLGIPAISKVLLPPFESPQQKAQDSELHSSTPTATTTTTTRAPRSTTTTTTRPPTTTTRPPTTTIVTTTTNVPVSENPPPNQPDVARIDLDSIPFPTTPPLEILIKSTTSPPKPNAIPTLATILLPPPYSSNSRPFQPPPPTPSTTVAASLLIPPPELPPGSHEGGSFLSLSFGFPNTPTNESPQKTAIGKALQERFGSNFNVQQLPSFINSLQPGQSKPAAPAVPGSPVSGTKFPPAPPVQGAPLGPVPAAPKPAAASDSGKYTGGFGGAPGVLGDQKEVGFGIKPGSGTASAPVAPPKPPVVVPVVTPVVAPVAAPVAPPVSPTQSPSGGKYTGGFGGPPGILVPYDQKNS
ncbi:flocculation protein FLO11-like [Hermetia illucens]|uniref:flocculation protein FLO11-like n=1 Tax=Hermetia illucens TaxID=343691 RepID=UPI0018CC193B|nr:flocculation protein FLO11-like [Hermetia illucens]